MDYDEAYEAAATYAQASESFREQVSDTERCSNGACFNRSIAAALLEKTARGRHLDLGAGNGFLMELSRRSGHEIVGVDVSMRSRAFITTQVEGATVYPSLDAAPGRFAIISALEVIEHVADPISLIARAMERLEDDGLLILSVPNVERPYWRSNGQGEERSFWLQGGVGDTSPHHLTRFTGAGLKRLMECSGVGDFHVGYTPLDVVTWLVWDLGMPLTAEVKLAGTHHAMPMLWFQKFLMENVVLKHWRRDPSQGYGIMVVARKRAGQAGDLKSLFETTLEDVIKRHLQSLDQDVASRVAKRFVTSSKNLLSRSAKFARRLSRPR
ncbi:MAG: class I SAM-dependent methyltransferase [Deltaproteobacteria bacterium]|nr:class I SAM-dependent methyltransferase [Deltaproteobacteria bacterium]